MLDDAALPDDAFAQPLYCQDFRCYPIGKETVGCIGSLTFLLRSKSRLAHPQSLHRRPASPRTERYEDYFSPCWYMIWEIEERWHEEPIRNSVLALRQTWQNCSSHSSQQQISRRQHTPRWSNVNPRRNKDSQILPLLVWG